jgi:hypothetical protein
MKKPAIGVFEGGGIKGIALAGAAAAGSTPDIGLNASPALRPEPSPHR